MTHGMFPLPIFVQVTAAFAIVILFLHLALHFQGASAEKNDP